MSWLLFMDESGHDHKQMPYEVRGGVAIRTNQIWPFIRSVQDLELSAFGAPLGEFSKEFKGSNLLDKKRIEWAFQDEWQQDSARRKNAKRFLTKGLQRIDPAREEFTAYGQACYEMAQGVFRLLRDHKAKLFASVIPRGIRAPDTYQAKEYLRKDQVFLLERFYYFLKAEREHGILVMDQVEDSDDRRFVRQLQRYYSKTQKGTQRADHVIPAPLFVSSLLSIPVQAADLAIYCLNWGYRRTSWQPNTAVRPKIKRDFGGWVDLLQYKSTQKRATHEKKLFGIVFVPNPYSGSGRFSA
jgi:hypothetical protein